MLAFSVILIQSCSTLNHFIEEPDVYIDAFREEWKIFYGTECPF